jgi:hypothetical protein
MRPALIVAAVAIGLLIVARMVVGLLRGRERDRLFQYVECSGFGWRGRVSRYDGRCPQCNQPLGEQKARHQGRGGG